MTRHPTIGLPPACGRRCNRLTASFSCRQGSSSRRVNATQVKHSGRRESRGLYGAGGQPRTRGVNPVRRSAPRSRVVSTSRARIHLWPLPSQFADLVARERGFLGDREVARISVLAAYYSSFVALLADRAWSRSLSKTVIWHGIATFCRTGLRLICVHNKNLSRLPSKTVLFLLSDFRYCMPFSGPSADLDRRISRPRSQPAESPQDHRDIALNVCGIRARS
ncbi:hypothetical protein FKP32DRAFT_9952 [Trametes sanguinea]|nr:hypothetical protein FKP32DRAFT_9952 [Trametes sanguinea]